MLWVCITSNMSYVITVLIVDYNNVSMHLLISLAQKTDSVFLRINKNSEMQTQNIKKICNNYVK